MLKKKLFMIIFVFMILSSFVSAQPPFQSNSNIDNGLQIFYPPIETLKQNTDFNFHIHVNNISNGLPLTNDMVSCYLHLYNSTGYHILESGVLEKSVNLYDHEILIDGNNFSNVDMETFFVWCNDTNYGGGVKGGFYVTPSGAEFTNAISIPIFLPIVLMLLTAAFFFLVGGFMERKEYKLVMLIFSGIFVVLSLSFGLIASLEFLAGFPKLYSFMTSFSFIFVVTLRIAAIVIPIIAMFYVVKRVFDARGYNIGKKFEGDGT